MKIKINREFKIGFFVLGCLLASYWGINFLKGKNIFSPNVEYYAIFKSVDGLQSTDAVLINGFKIGLVKNIEFHDLNTGRFRVTLLVNKKYRLPLNTTAKLVSTDIMGGKAIKLEVSPGSSYFAPGDTLPTSIEIGLIDQLAYQMSPVKEKAETMMEELSKTLVVLQKVLNEQNQANISESIEHLNKTLQHVSMLAAGLDTMTNSPNGSIKTSLNNIASITSNLKKNNSLISNSIKNISNITDSLSKSNLTSTIAKLDSSLAEMKVVISKISSGKGTLGKLIHSDSLYNNLESASLQLDLLIKDMKANPKRYVNFSIIDLSRTKYVKDKKRK